MAAVDIIRGQNLASFVITNGDLITGRVLDVGCGSKPYKRLFPECEWVGLDERPVGEVQADMRSMPLDDDSFDTVLCVDALNFTPYPHEALAEMVRVLKPGGNLVIAVRTTAPDDTVFFGIHSAGLIALLRDLGMEGLDGAARNVALSGYFTRGEAENFWTNQTWLEGTGNLDLNRFTEYLDSRYPAVSGACCTKPMTKE